MYPLSQLRSKQVNESTDSHPIADFNSDYRHSRSVRFLRAPRSLATLALLFCSSTLMCCALPAALVMIGAGSVLASLLSWLPAMVILSEQKLLVFGIAGISLIMAGFALKQSSRMPCPLDPSLSLRCRRRLSQGRRLYALSCSAFIIGIFFAYILPALQKQVA
jgi:hypothetical protein